MESGRRRERVRRGRRARKTSRSEQHGRSAHSIPGVRYAGPVTGTRTPWGELTTADQPRHRRHVDRRGAAYRGTPPMRTPTASYRPSDLLAARVGRCRNVRPRGLLRRSHPEHNSVYPQMPLGCLSTAPVTRASPRRPERFDWAGAEPDQRPREVGRGTRLHRTAPALIIGSQPPCPVPRRRTPRKRLAPLRARPRLTAGSRLSKPTQHLTSLVARLAWLTISSASGETPPETVERNDPAGRACRAGPA